MSATAAERIAYTVECFFNAARIEDSAERTGLEQKVCQCLLDHDKGKPFAVLHRQALFLYRDALSPPVSYAAPQADGPSVWTDGKKISRLDPVQYQGAQSVILLGAAGLVLTMPGLSQAEQKKAGVEYSGGVSSNNNNNNKIGRAHV